MEATIYFFNNGEWTDRTTSFPFKTEATLKKHLTSIYGTDNMDNVFWDIWQEPEDEGLEEIEEPETEIGSYLKRKMRRKR